MPPYAESSHTQVLCGNGCLLPPEALFVIRYHSFYALHQHNAYDHLLDDEDRRMVPWLKAFQKCDLHELRHTCSAGLSCA